MDLDSQKSSYHEQVGAFFVVREKAIVFEQLCFSA